MLEDLYVENLNLLKKHLPEIEKSLQEKMQSNFLEMEESIEKLSESVEVFCIYKIAFDEKLLNWLNEYQERKIIFLETDLARIDYCLHKINAKDFLSHKRIEFCLLEEGVVKKICWNNLFKEIDVITWSSYQLDPVFLKLKEETDYMQRGIEATFAWYSDLAINDLSNFYANLQKKEKKYSFSSLKDKAKNVPAIICGAGPSLALAEKKLRDLNDKALIFAGGTAMNVLSQKDIVYHFGASIEKDNLRLRLKQLNDFEKPFFYRPVISPENLKVVDGPLLYVSDHETLPIQRWIEDKLKIKSVDIDGGWTVTTFLISLASFMGCSPIILVGVDLCFAKEKYAYDLFTENDPKKYKLSEVENLCGEKVTTQRDFLIAASWIEEFAQKTDQTTLINCSKGLDFKSVENKDFDQIDMFFSKQMDLFNFSHSLTTLSDEIKTSSEDIKKVLEDIILELKDAEQLIAQLLIGWENEQTFQENLFEKLLKEKAIYRFLLHPIWIVWQPLLKQKAAKEGLFSSLEIEKINKIVFMQKIIFSHLDIARKAYEKI